MNSLIFLTAHKLKNKLFELLKSPGRLILTLAFIALLVMNFSIEKISAPGSRPMSEFYAIIFVFYILCFILEAKKGFEHGGTMFSLSDVNFLFMSPIKPAAVLFHAMAGRIGTSLWMGLAFVYQFSLLRSSYNISFADMVVAVIGYGAVAFLSQTAGMLIYFFTCGQEEKLKKAKKVFYTLCAVFAVPFLLSFNLSSPSLTDAAESLTSAPMKLFPVAGWVLAAVEGVVKGQTLQCIFAVVAGFAFTAFAFVILSTSKHGYYEDVLLTAEKIADSKGVRNVKIEEKTLREENRKIGKGKGASAVFYKHRLENRRTKATLLAPTSLFYLVLLAVYGTVLKSDVSGLFAVSCTVSVLTVLSGRWLKELTMPYIYLIPDRPVKKLFYMLPEMLPRIVTESVLQCLVIGVICRLGTVTIIALTVARIAFCFVLMSSALITARIFREREKNNIFAAVCIFIGCIFAIPSVVAFIFLVNFGMGMITGLGAMAAVNVLTGFILLFFARNLLSFSD